MPKTWRALAILALVGGATGTADAQDVRPLSPVLRSGEVERAGADDPAEAAVVPLPDASSRAATADGARARAAVLPAAWTDVASRWQPHWVAAAPPSAFGVDRWSAWFAAAGLVPRVEPHPFFSPWGLYAYEGWIFDRYRSAWATTRDDGRFAEAAGWLHRGDRAMLDARWLDAATAYRRVTLVVPELPHGYLGLGAALAVLEEDVAAAQALRQGVDLWPAWMPLDVGWARLWGNGDRLTAMLEACRKRASAGSVDSRFVAGTLHLFGGLPGIGRDLLGSLETDPHAETLLARSPR